MHPSLLNDVKITVVEAAAGAAQTALDSDILDMSGYEGVVFIAMLGDVTSGSVLTLAAQQNTANSASGMATLAGSATFTAGATDADSKALVLDVYRPRERYVRAYLTRTTQDAIVGGVIAIQYGATKKPQTQHASVIDSDTIIEAAEA